MFKLGLGGRIGNGRQWMPWIHVQDEIAVIDFLMQRNDASGPYNACAPEPVRNREFAQCLGKVLHRPAIIPVPALLLRAGLGEMSGLLLGGQRARPARLLAAGFTFRFNDVQSALDELSSRL
ncbi:Epimerase family protein [compost metagenome]